MDFPETGKIGEAVLIRINYEVGSSSCFQFGRIIETTDGINRDIEIESVYTGCVCTDDLILKQIDYEFIPDTVGTHIFRFKSSPNETIVIEFEIN